MYGQRKPIAERIPLVPATSRKSGLKRHVSQPSIEDPAGILSTLAVTEGETATETELDTDTDTDTELDPVSKRQSSSTVALSYNSQGTATSVYIATSSQAISQHDLLHKYFRRDTVLLHNVDLLR
jgi:phosphatidylethanolamine N-methyltransferase